MISILFPNRMLIFFMTIIEVRKILGKKSKDYSDHQVQEILNQLEHLAELMLEAAENGSK